MQLKSYLLVVAIGVFYPQHLSANLLSDSGNFEVLFEEGIQAAREEDWEACILNVEKSIVVYHDYESELFSCHHKCTKRQEKLSEYVLSNTLMLIEMRKKHLGCLDECKRDKHLNEYTNIGIEMFRNKEPYSYLQHAYLMRNKTNDFIKSAQHAFTYLQTNTESERMDNNLYNLMESFDIPDSEYIDLEMPRFQESFELGEFAYFEKNDTNETIKYMEKSLQEFYKDLEVCRIWCSEDSQRDFSLDKNINIARSYANALICLLDCHNVLKPSYRMSYMEESSYLTLHNYLQYSYRNGKNWKNSMECVLSYLLFNRTSWMIENLHYLEEYGLLLRGNHFTPRKEALNYYQELVQDGKILNGLKKYLGDRTIEVPKENKEIEKIITRYMPEPYLYQKENEMRTEDIKVIMEEGQLNGTDRMAADGFITNNECQQLIDAVIKFGEAGDGYQELAGTNRALTPFTKSENFFGITLGKVAHEAYLEKLNLEVAQLFHDLSEKSRRYVKSYFNIDEPLFHTFTHLVCRTAIEGVEERQNMSHPIHADNCKIEDGGKTCRKTKEYDHWRSWSAVMYLNEDFEGGEFVFADSNKEIEAKLKPKCGRLVSFKASDYHGILPVKKGQRCGIAMWFTSDSNRDQREHLVSQLFLQALEEKRKEQETANRKKIRDEL